jgi:hypothetical protein
MAPLSIIGNHVDFMLPSNGRYTVDVLSMQGRQIMNIADETGQSGPHSCLIERFPGSGCFIIRLSTAQEKIVQPLMILK